MGDDHPAPLPPVDARRPSLSHRGWLTLAAATAVASAAIALFPRSGGDQPPIGALAMVAAIVTGATTTALYLIVRRELGLSARIAASFTAAFALIACVKFVLAPLGLYEVNAVRSLQDVLGSVADPVGATVTAAIVFGLYAVVYIILFRIWHPRGKPGTQKGPRSLASILAGTAIVAVTGIGVLVFALLAGSGQYLDFVFTSGVAGLIALSLAAAATLIATAFRSLAVRPGVIVELGAVVGLFWLGLGFLALYHALWIVYVLVLGSIWPLRTVVPK